MLKHIAKYGTEKFNEFLVNPHPENLKTVSPDSFQIMTRFFSHNPVFPAFTEDPDIFRTLEGNILLDFDDDFGNRRTIEFTPTHIEYFDYELGPETRVTGPYKEDIDGLLEILELK